MKNLLLIAALMFVVVGSAYGQTVMYRGTTSQGQPIQFVTNVQAGQRCVDQVSFSNTLTCPSGATPGWGVGIGGCIPIQDDGSFMFTVPPVDGGLVTYVFSGTITNEGANGNISFQAPHLLVTPNSVDCQFCDSGDVTWTAQPVRGSAESEGINFADQPFYKYTDKRTGNVVTIYRLNSE